MQDIGALEEDETLTMLGGHLAALPLEPQLGKLLLYGILFDCVDPIMTIACAMAYRCEFFLQQAFHAYAECTCHTLKLGEQPSASRLS